jgi:hypothetical protein
MHYPFAVKETNIVLAFDFDICTFLGQGELEDAVACSATLSQSHTENPNFHAAEISAGFPSPPQSVISWDLEHHLCTNCLHPQIVHHNQSYSLTTDI